MTPGVSTAKAPLRALEKREGKRKGQEQERGEGRRSGGEVRREEVRGCIKMKYVKCPSTSVGGTKRVNTHCVC